MNTTSASVRSLVDLLRGRAERHGDRRLYTLLADGEDGDRHLTYAAIDRRARAIGAALAEQGLAGQRVLLVYPPGPGFLEAFFGCLFAGAVAVPAYPPRPNRSSERLDTIVADAAPALALTTTVLRTKIGHHLTARDGQLAVPLESCESIDDAQADHWREPVLTRDSLAFLQYTSGSTASPKGVMVRHRDILANERVIQRAFRQDENSVIVGWLPLFHDMGLIGNVLQPLFVGARCVLLSPVTFLRRPVSWLEAISRYGGTTSGGPDFAYDLCVRTVSEEQRTDLDLRSWTVAFNGAEPVRAATLERFAAAFAPHGFDRRAFYPCYGLAEATLMVSGGDPDREPVIREVDAATLEDHRFLDIGALPGDRRPTSRRLVSSGRAGEGLRIEIVDPVSRRVCAADAVGEVWVHGDSVTAGYWRREEETAEVFDARLADDPSPPFLRTGDLGCLVDGELFVTGRLKDLIILRGRNHYPQDLERTLEASHPELRSGASAAFSVESEGTERLVLVAELSRRHADSTEVISEAIRRQVAAEHGVAIHEVVLIRQSSIAKTSSGKIRRRACRADYLEGRLRVLGRSRLTFDEEGATPAESLDLQSAMRVERTIAERREIFLRWLTTCFAEAARLDPRGLDPTVPLSSQGLDSLVAIELQGRLEDAAGMTLSLDDLLTGATLEQLADGLALTFEDPARIDDPAKSPATGDISADDTAEHGDLETLLSHGERALWLLQQRHRDSTAYHIAGAAWLDGELDEARLERVLASLVDRHAALRTTFHEVDGEPRTHLATHLPFGIESLQVSPEALDDWLAEFASRRFDLATGPLLRVAVVTTERRGAAARVLAMVCHHLVTDFVSLALLLRQMVSEYAAESPDTPRSRRGGQLGRADLVRDQQRRLGGLDGERLWRYWSAQLADLPAQLELPYDRPPGAVSTVRGGRRSIQMDDALSFGLAALAEACRTTRFNLLLAAVHTLLYRITGSLAPAVASPVSIRPPEMSDAFGFGVNTVILRADLAGDPPFVDLVERLRPVVLGALRHRDLPFSLLVERLRPETPAGLSPFTQMLFAWQQDRPGDPSGLAAFATQHPGLALELGDWRLEPFPLPPATSQLELVLSLAEGPRGWMGEWTWAVDLFDSTTIQRLSKQLVCLLHGLVADPTRRLGELPLLGAGERHQVLVEWAKVPDVPGPDHDLPTWLAAQMARTPEAPALWFDGRTLSHGELARRVDDLAATLRTTGVGGETVVGLRVERSPELVIGWLAIVRAGGAVLTLDPELPAARLAFQLADAEVSFVLSSSALLRETRRIVGAGIRVLELGKAEPRPVGSGRAPVQPLPTTHAAYVIYTSGSTGRPKGVVVSHGAAVRHLSAVCHRHGLSPSDRWLHTASFSFDVAIEDLLAPLAAGASVALAGPGLLAPEALLRLVRRCGATILDLAPAYLAALIREARQRGEADLPLRRVLVGGEALPRETVAAWWDSPLASALLINAYGPTEATITATVAEVESVPGGHGVPIGRAVGERSLYVLDRHGRPVGPGVAGELVLGGPLLARGYLRRPGRTAESFVPDPQGMAGARRYRTGDLVRWWRDGQLEPLGRIDQQVKIRGFRIELGEIETVLARHPGVGLAVVSVASDDGSAVGRHLVAHLCPPPGGEVAGLPTDHELQTHLASHLPTYMVPRVFVRLATLPLAPNGKVDRRSLPQPERAPDYDLETVDLSPREEVLAALWLEVLGDPEGERHRIRPDDEFFALGGHSLLAIQLASRMRQSFGLDIELSQIFETSTLSAMARWIDAAEGAHVARPGDRHRGTDPGEERPPLVRCSRGGRLRPSPGQLRLWFLDRLEPGSARYHLAAVLETKDPLRTRVLDRVLAEIVRRHEVLRTYFEPHEDEPEQVVEGAPGQVLACIDLRHLAPHTARATAERVTRGEARRPFDLSRGPLLRPTLISLGGGEHRLLLVFHHVVADGWSLALFEHEMATLYEAFAADRPSPLGPLEIQVADTAEWQRKLSEGPLLDPQIEIWRHRLADLEPLELPTDRPYPTTASGRGTLVPFALEGSPVFDLASVARRHRTTPFVVLVAVFQVFLARLTGAHDIAIGTPVANRGRPELEPLIGFFVNTVVLRTDTAGLVSLDGLVERVREIVAEALANQDVPFDRLVEALRIDRRGGRSPLFQVLLAVERARPVTSRPGVPRWHGRRIPTASAKFDLSLELELGDERLDGVWELADDLFDPTTIQRFSGHLHTLLTHLLADPERSPWEAPWLDEAERHQLLREPASVPVAFAERSLIEGFAAQVRARPEAIAVVWGEQQLTYRELARRAGRLGRRLRRWGVGPEVFVAVCLERSIDLVVALLGILDAGGAYVPLDPTYPPERLRFVLADLGTPVVVSERSSAAVLGDADMRPLWIDDAEDDLEVGRGGDFEGLLSGDRGVGPQNAAYVIYTSGSTGQPKGVVVTHANVLRLFAATQRDFGFDHDDVWTLFHSYAFDFSVWELWGALLHGGRLVVVPFWSSRSPDAFLELLADQSVTVLNQTPSAFEPLINAQNKNLAPLALRWVIFGGEALDVRLLAPWFHRHGDQRPRLVNMYGITETTVHVSYRPLTREDAEGTRPCGIGGALADLRLRVVDRAGRLVPLGVAGEAWVGGDGLARGYLGRPGLTASRFVPDPFAQRAGERLYRAGDRLRSRPGDDFEYLGRIDQQVKIRGHRIELGEIEATLRRVPGVEAAVVLDAADPRGGRQLVGYVVRGDARLGVDALRQNLAQSLPAVMVPAGWVFLDAIPLTVNGKVDRRALATLSPAVGAPTPSARAQTPVEEMLAGIFAEVLGLDPVGRDDDFFALGGHSLLATRVVARIRRAFDVDLPLATLFASPTVSQLADVVSHRSGLATSSAGAAITPVGRGAARFSGDFPLTWAQRRLWLVHQLEPTSPVYNMPAVFELSGPLDPPALGAALDAVTQRQESLRTTFVSVAGEPRQRIHPPSATPLPHIDLCHLTATVRRQESERLAQREARRVFDLNRGPLARTLLLRLDEARHHLLVTLHHIIADGWSVEILLRELADGLETTRQGLPPALAELPIQVADFAVWQQERQSDGELDRQLEIWRQRLGGLAMPLELPSDRPRPTRPSWRGADFPLALGAALSAELAALGRRRGATLFMVLLAGFQTLLGRLTGRTDLAVGSPVANRDRQELEPLVGFFVNTLVLRTDLAGEPSFGELIDRVKAVALAAYAHQDVPFERLVAALDAGRDPRHAPLVQVVLSLAEVTRELVVGDLRLRPRPLETGTAKFDLTLELTPGPDGLSGRFEYRDDLYDRTTINRWGRQLTRLLSAVVADADLVPSTLSLLSKAERHQLLVEPGAAEPLAETPTVIEGFEAVARARPTAVALTCGERRLTYGELDRWANRLAHRLAAFGAGAETFVGVCVERTVELVVAILAVSKSGSAYMPIDPATPDERLAFLLADASVRLVIADASKTTAITALGVRVLDPEDSKGVETDASVGAAADIANHPPPRHLDPRQAAYLIYTSGSTGRPKGVVISQRALSRLFTATARDFAFGREDVWTLFHSVAFDFSVWELWGALLYGGRLVVVPRRIARSPEAFLALLESEEVTVLNQTPSAFVQLVRAEGMASSAPDLALRWVIFGGEALDPGSLRPWVERHGDHRPRLVNMYGITETTVHVTRRRVRAREARADAASLIGGPMADLRLDLVDHHGELVPLGVTGELWVRGDGLARGYLGRPGLTATRFVPDPFGQRPGGRCYRSGDLARRRADFELCYLGRLDHQVKIRGHRIELGEVEAALVREPGVEQAVAWVRTDLASPQLVAAITGEPLPDGTELRRTLATKLPDYLVPARVHALASLPLTANGKVDRKSLWQTLSTLEDPRPTTPPESTPRTSHEATLADIWGEVLGHPSVGIDDNFFDLGGDSILGIQIVARARDAGLGLTPQDVFLHPTVAGLAAIATASAVEDPVATTADGSAAGLPVRPPVPHAPGAEPRPSDFPRVDLSQRQLEQIVAQVTRRGGSDIEDLLPLTPLQQGMVFHSLAAPDSGVYLHQQSYTLEGEAVAGDNAPRMFAEAFRRVVARHQILRASIHSDATGTLFQVIHREVALPFEVFDFRALSPDRRQGAMAALSARELRRVFDLEQAPLLRLRWIRLDDITVQINWSFHLLLLDGWSTPLVLHEAMTLYGDLRHGRSSALPPAVPFSRYFDWLETRDQAASETFWRRELAGFAAATELGQDGTPQGPASPDDLQHAFCRLDRATSEALSRFAGSQRLTLATLFQGAWALLLARRSGVDDVLFGNVVSGRPADLPEVDSIVGLFLTTLPLRARVDDTTTLREWLLDLQRRQVEARQHDYCGQVDLQRWSDVPAGDPLFESALIFQNVPERRREDALTDELRVLEMGSHEVNSFPLTLVVEPGPEVLIDMAYDRRRFMASTMAGMVDRIQRLLLEMVQRPEESPAAIAALSAEVPGLQLEGFEDDLETW